jgi:predicted ATPase
LGCDEFQVTDAFTAVALKGIFEVLLEQGVVIVVRACPTACRSTARSRGNELRARMTLCAPQATANREPKALNSDGEILSDVFAPFAENLEHWCEPYAMAATVDYRRAAAAHALTLTGEGEGGATSSGTFFAPLDESTTAAVEARFAALAGVPLRSPHVAPTTLRVLFNRSLVRVHQHR